MSSRSRSLRFKTKRQTIEFLEAQKRDIQDKMERLKTRLATVEALLEEEKKAENNE